MNPQKIIFYLIVGGVGLIVLYFLKRGLGGAVADIVTGAVRATNVVVGETVQTAGTFIGIPRTNEIKCQQDLAAGKYLAASASCPAGDFFRGVFTKLDPTTTIRAAPVNDVIADDNLGSMIEDDPMGGF